MKTSIKKGTRVVVTEDNKDTLYIYGDDWEEYLRGEQRLRAGCSLFLMLGLVLAIFAAWLGIISFS